MICKSKQDEFDNCFIFMHLWDYNRQKEVKAKAKMSLEIASSAYAFSTIANSKMSNQK